MITMTTVKTAPKVEMIDLHSAFGTYTVLNGDLTDEKARRALTSGLCADLAATIHELNGNQIVFVGNVSTTEAELAADFAEDPEYVMDFDHVAVLSCDGVGYMDGNGYVTTKAYRRFYGEDVHIVRGTRAMAEYYRNNSADLTAFALAVIEHGEDKRGYPMQEYYL
jgi:hypothetical protein